MRSALVGLVLVGCATVPPPPQKPIPLTADELACLDSLEAAGARFTSDELLACERDSDCRGVSALLSGQCGTVVNQRAFQAHLAQFEAQTRTCAPVVQVVPRCLELQPVCREKRCTAEPIAEIPEECGELTSALRAEAASANVCSDDAECTTFEDRPTTVAFVTSALERREKAARACGTIEPELFAVPHAPDEAFCVEHRCVSERAAPQFTTVVRGRTFTPPELDVGCIKDAFLSSFKSWEKLTRKRQWELQFMANLDAEGRLNQFEFLVPAKLPPEAQRAFAWRLHQCKAISPALFRGKPVAIRKLQTIRWVSP